MSESQLKHARILIVDDQESNRLLLEGLLKKQGYSNYKSLSDPRQVLPTVQEWKPDLILLDLMMPHMDGFAVMQVLKPLIAPEDYLPILVLTADVTSEAKRRALSEGAMDFLTKPFDAAEVTLRVSNLLQTRFLHLQLQNQNVILEEKVRERTAQLEWTHHKLESILNSAGEGIYGVDLEGRTTFINPAALQMLEYSLDEMLGQLQHAMTHHTRPDGTPYPREECPIYLAFMDGQVHRVDDELFWRKDGSSFVVEYTSTPLWEGNEIVGAVVTFNDISERKRAEEALRQRELEFRSLAENLPDIVVRFDPQLRHVYINEVIEKITGIPAQFFIGKTNQDLAMPESKVALWDNKLHQIFNSGQEGTLEFEFSSPTGLRYFESRLVPEFGPTGEVEKVLSIVRDITERKHAEEEIKYHARLLRHINDAIIATDDQFHITAWNRAAEVIYGWTSAEVMGRNVAEILGSGLSDQQQAEANELLKAKSSSRSERIHSRKNGRPVYVEENTIALMDEHRKVTGYVSVNRDITERKRAEEALQEKEHLLSEAQRIGHIGSWSFDLSKDILQFSDEMYRLFDVSAEEFPHTSEGFLSLIYASDRLMITEWMARIRAGRQPGELEFRVFRKNGELRYLHCRGAVQFDQAGNSARFIGTAQDVTERKLAEIQIRQQIQRLTALSKIDQAIISSFDLGVTLEVVLSQVISQLQVDAADVLILDPDAQSLEYAAGQGFRTAVIESTPLRLAESQAARERRSIHVQNLANKPDSRLLSEQGATEGFACYFGLPLIVKGKVKGLLEVFHRAELQPYPEWIDFLRTLAGQAAIAIENVQLFENLERSNRELVQAYDATIEGWSRALDLRDKETEGHTQRVTEMTLDLARVFGLPEEELLYIRWGALLHDIGKMAIPDNILLKPSELTQEEWQIMRQHPEFAYSMLSPITYLHRALDIPYYHHEKWDGTGYPRGLKGQGIPLVARLFAVVDVWDALRSDRPYRKAWTREKTLEHIRSLSGIAFDPKVVEYFLDLVK